jgi:hypothetical protein
VDCRAGGIVLSLQWLMRRVSQMNSEPLLQIVDVQTIRDEECWRVESLVEMWPLLCYEKLHKHSRSKTRRRPFTRACRAQVQISGKDVRSR